METGIGAGPAVTSWQAMEGLALHFGFLPLFDNDIPGFSVEAYTPPEYWFSADREGPWEWKGPVARNGKCVYGKFFAGKACFVSLDWFAELANIRRGGEDFDARYAAGQIGRQDKLVYDTLVQHGSALTRTLKAACGYCKDGRKGFDAVMMRLQMQTDVCVADFTYEIARSGHPYGWGMARYTTPEAMYGEAAVACTRAAEDSTLRMTEHLARLLPHANRARLARLLRG